MNNQTILHKKAGQTIPLELLQLILDRKPNSFGFAVQNIEADNKPDLSIIREEECPPLEALTELMENAKQWPMILYFGELTDDDHHKDDIQPFVIHDADDAPFITFMIEGDFPKFSEVGSGHTEHANLANKIIIPHIIDLCEMTDGDLPKIMSKLGGDTFNNTLLSHIGHRGVLTVMPLEGEAILLGKNELGENYDWGSTSQRHSYGDAVQEPEVVVEAAPKKKFWSGKKTPEAPKTEVKDAATPGDAPRASVPAAGNGTQQDPDKPLSKDDDLESIRPPSFIHKNDDVKAWYKTLTGSVPQNWKKRIPVRVKKSKAVVIHDLASLAAAMKAAEGTLTAVGKAPTSGGEIKSQREDKAEVKTEAKVEDNNLPIIGGKDLEKVLDFVAKHLDGQSNQMVDPKTIQEIESKLPTFSDSLGIKPHEMLNWPVSGVLAMAKMDSRAVALAFIEMRSLWRNTLTAADLVGTATPVKEKVTTTVKKSGEGTTITESIATPVPVAASGKKGWWAKKKVA